MSTALKQIAWAHVFIVFNINLGPIDILPNWVGYILILMALPALAEEEPSAMLIRPLGIILAIWEGIVWFYMFFNIQLDVPLVTVLSTVIGVYFHFQLLTNIASISENHDCPQTDRILTLRTIRTILITFFSLPIPWEANDGAGWFLGTIILIVHLVVTIWIVFVLFSLKKSLEAEELYS